MASAAGMVVLAVLATVLHLATVSILDAFARRIRRPHGHHVEVVLIYKEGRGVLREVLAGSTSLRYQTSLITTNKLETARSERMAYDPTPVYTSTGAASILSG